MVVLVAWLIRRNLEEPPAFKEAQEAKTLDGAVRGPSPLTLLFRYHKAALARVAAAAMINTVNVVFTVWSLSFATSVVGLDRSTMLLVPVLANAVALLAIPVSGMIADRVGRKPVFIIGALGSGFAMTAYLNAVQSGAWVSIFVVGVIMSGLLYSMSNAVWPAFYAEMFPTSVRVTGLALGTQIGFALSGGLTPVLASALAGAEGDNWLRVGVFVAAIGVVTALAALTAKETKNFNLDEIDAVHTARGEAADLARAGVDVDKLPERRTSLVVGPVETTRSTENEEARR